MIIIPLDEVEAHCVNLMIHAINPDFEKEEDFEMRLGMISILVRLKSKCTKETRTLRLDSREASVLKHIILATIPEMLELEDARIFVPVVEAVYNRINTFD